MSLDAQHCLASIYLAPCSFITSRQEIPEACSTITMPQLLNSAEGNHNSLKIHATINL